MANIVGSSYHGNGNKLLIDAHEKLARYTSLLSIIIWQVLYRDKAFGNSVMDDSTFRLLLLINNLDIQLMQSSLKQLGK